MAGRGTDILLGGNPEFLARSEMRRRQDTRTRSSRRPSATTRTSIRRMLEAARRSTSELYEKFKKETDAEHDKRGGRWAACTSSAPSATRAAASTTSCAAAPAVRATRAARSSSSRLEDDLMRLFGSERITPMIEKLGMDEDTPH